MRDVPQVDLRAVDPLSHATAQVADVLRAGGVVLVPTETVYGILCLPTSSQAVAKVFTMKARPVSRRLPIIVSSLTQGLQALPFEWTSAAIALAQEFWPGPLTIACKVRSTAHGWLAGRDEAAVRAPNHALVRSLAIELGPLLMTSANQHGHDTPHTMNDALTQLLEPPALAVDGGCLSGAPSTLVNVNLQEPVIERQGALGQAAIRRVLDAI